MTKRMLIDASHPDETRVVVLDGNTVEEFDFERADRKPLKGNIYLAKVTRVEPSLQAAFVEYGGNRHGFLPFSEIHPDYYRIPIADREALLAEEEAISQKLLSEADEAADADEEVDGPSDDAEDGGDGEADADDDDSEDGEDDNDDATAKADEKAEAAVEELETESSVDTVGGDEMEEQLRRRAQLLRKYKIQEVIRRRQVMLVQVTKEERGTKGAALTTYLSLAGRYCVLMPNSGKGGGISRKISNVSDRRRLKKVLSELNIPQGMAVIVRTAGGQRSKAEIRRDYDYLIRLWDQIRNKTLESSAPCLIHEEGNLLNRAIRDQYTREMDEVLVEGEEGYKAAKNFMKMLMPSHAKKVKLYKDERMPLFQRFQVESNLDSMYSPQVQLKSGGSIVLNPTEALVAIDVNSGKATRERHIEETALKTNLEAAEEIGRQLRLRDLAGLIVIDFIDMEESRHNRDVERRLKEALKSDRARIQLGRISPFGLLELSRQRLRPSLVEMSSVSCPHCGGAGVVRSNDSACMQILRSLTDIGINHTNSTCRVKLNNELALYLLSEKRAQISEIEERYGVKVQVEVDESLNAGEFSVDRISDSDGPIKERGEVKQQQEEEEEEEREDTEESGGKKRGRRGGRKRRKGGQKAEAKDDRKTSNSSDEESDDEDEDQDEDQRQSAGGEESDDEGKSRKRRRRGRRGGRRRSRKQKEATDESKQESGSDDADSDSGRDSSSDDAQEGEDTGEAETKEAKPAAKKRSRSRKPPRGKAEADGEDQDKARDADEAGEEEPKAKDKPKDEEEPAEAASSSDAKSDAPSPAAAPEQDNAGDRDEADEKAKEPVGAGAEAERAEKSKPKKRGWWNLGG